MASGYGPVILAWQLGADGGFGEPSTMHSICRTMNISPDSWKKVSHQTKSRLIHKLWYFHKLKRRERGSGSLGPYHKVYPGKAHWVSRKEKAIASQITLEKPHEEWGPQHFLWCVPRDRRWTWNISCRALHLSRKDNGDSSSPSVETGLGKKDQGLLVLF